MDNDDNEAVTEETTEEIIAKTDKMIKDNVKDVKGDDDNMSWEVTMTREDKKLQEDFEKD